MFRKLSSRLSKRTAIILVSLTLVVAIAVVSTLAYLIVKTNELKNTFEPGSVIVTVDENGIVTNSEDSAVSVYVRVAVVVNYQDTDGNVLAQTPVSTGENPDYTITADSNWLYDSINGFYYYTAPVTAGGTTASNVTVTKKTASIEASGTTYNLTVTYLVEAIQATPTDAVEKAWGVTVGGEGTIASLTSATQ